MTALDYPAGNAGNVLTFQRTKRILGECEVAQAPSGCYRRVSGTYCYFIDLYRAAFYWQSKKNTTHSGKEALRLSKYLPAGPLPLQAEKPGAASFEDVSIKSQGLSFVC